MGENISRISRPKRSAAETDQPTNEEKNSAVGRQTKAGVTHEGLDETGDKGTTPAIYEE
jgi:hypothetical protein